MKPAGRWNSKTQARRPHFGIIYYTNKDIFCKEQKGKLLQDDGQLWEFFAKNSKHLTCQAVKFIQRDILVQCVFVQKFAFLLEFGKGAQVNVGNSKNFVGSCKQSKQNVEICKTSTPCAKIGANGIDLCGAMASKTKLFGICRGWKKYNEAWILCGQVL